MPEDVYYAQLREQTQQRLKKGLHGGPIDPKTIFQEIETAGGHKVELNVVGIDDQYWTRLAAAKDACQILGVSNINFVMGGSSGGGFAIKFVEIADLVGVTLPNLLGVISLYPPLNEIYDIENREDTISHKEFLRKHHSISVDSLLLRTANVEVLTRKYPFAKVLIIQGSLDKEVLPESFLRYSRKYRSLENVKFVFLKNEGHRTTPAFDMHIHSFLYNLSP